MGVIGVAPSAEFRAKLTAREADVASRGGAALPPDAVGAVPTDPAIARHSPAHDPAARDRRQPGYQAADAAARRC